MGQNISVDPNEHLCYACYKSHCSIIESLRAVQDSNVVLREWGSKHSNENTDQLTKAILAAVIHVGNLLLMGKAVLLPLVCKVFLMSYCPNCTDSTLSPLRLQKLV